VGKYRNRGDGMRVDKYTVRRLAFFIPLLIASLWLIVWGFGQMSQPPRFSCDRATVSVEGGQTLWDIAHQHCEGDVSAVIDRLVGIYGTEINTWQVIHLPIASPRS